MPGGELYQIDDYIQEACRDEAHLGALAAGAGRRAGGKVTWNFVKTGVDATRDWITGREAYRSVDGGGKSLMRVAFGADGKLWARWRSLKTIARAAQARQASTTANLAIAPLSTAGARHRRNLGMGDAL